MLDSPAHSTLLKLHNNVNKLRCEQYLRVLCYKISKNVERSEGVKAFVLSSHSDWGLKLHKTACNLIWCLQKSAFDSRSVPPKALEAYINGRVRDFCAKCVRLGSGVATRWKIRVRATCSWEVVVCGLQLACQCQVLDAYPHRLVGYS